MIKSLVLLTLVFFSNMVFAESIKCLDSNSTIVLEQELTQSISQFEINDMRTDLYTLDLTINLEEGKLNYEVLEMNSTYVLGSGEELITQGEMIKLPLAFNCQITDESITITKDQ